MHRHFESKLIAAAYAKHRPETPEFMVDKAMQFLREKRKIENKNKFSLLLDVGCGSGQSIVKLSSYFDEAIGIDPSQSQIDEAKNTVCLKNVRFQVGVDEKLPADGNTVDMVFVGQAFHWFNFDKFYEECSRVLKKEGCLVAFGYDIPFIESLNVDVSNNFDEIKEFVEKCHFDKRIDHLFDHYKTLFHELPSRDKVLVDEDVMEKKMTLSNFINYLSSFSGYHNHRVDTIKELEKSMTEKEAMQKYTEDHDILQKLEKSLEKKIGKTDEINVKWKAFVLMASNILK